MKRVVEGKADEECHKYFVRFGKGDYPRRFILSLVKGNKIKIRGSFEWANDFVKFIKENKEVKFSGSVLMKDKIGKEGKKKGGLFAYEVSESSLSEFENAYFSLVNVNDSEIVLKIKKSLPKPGKNSEKIDDKFCSMDLDEKYWLKAKERFFWDIPDNVKKARIENELKIDEIIAPKNESDPAMIRALAKRKGKIVRKIEVDGNVSEKIIDFVA